EFRRKGGFDGDLFAGGGQAETDAVGVQEIAAERRHAFDGGGRAVEGVAGHRVPDAGEVNADLVGASGTDFDCQQGEAAEAAQNAVFGPGGASLGEARGHAGAANGVAGDGAVDAAAVGFDLAVDEREVHLFDLAVCKLGGEVAVRVVVLSDQQDAGGEAVEAVDNAGAEFAGDTRQGIEAAEQCVDEGAGVHPGAGVDHHAGGLIDGNQVVIFVEDREWDG